MTKQKLLYLVILLTCVSSLLAISCAKPQAPEVIEWNFAQYTAPTAGIGNIATVWCDEVAKRTNGRLIVKCHWSSSLAGPKEMPEAVKQGLCDMVWALPSYNPTVFPFSALANMPLILPAGFRVDQIVLSYNEFAKTSSALHEEYDKVNAVFAFQMSTASYDMISNKTVRSVADLKGLRIKSFAQHGEVFKLLDAVPVTIPAGETYGALQTGVVAAGCFAPASLYTYKLHEIAKYYIKDLGMGAVGGSAIINKDSYDALPDDIKGVIEDLQVEAALYSQYYYSGEKMMQEAWEGFEAEGVETIPFPASERAQIEAVAPRIWEKWIEENGGEPAREAFDAYCACAEKVMKEYPNGLPEWEPGA